MKFEGIFVAIISLMTLFSCSMGDDAILNDLDKEISDVNKDYASEAYLVFGVQSNGAVTKVGEKEDNTTAQDVKTCSVILYSGNNILAVKDDVAVGENKNLLQKSGDTLFFYTKQTSGLEVMVIANPKSKYANFSTMDAVKDQVEEDETFDATNLLKIGTGAVSFDNAYKVIGDIPAYKVNVSVKQRAALIRLNNVTVKSLTGKKAEVKITGIHFYNLKKKSKVDPDASEYMGGGAYLGAQKDVVVGQQMTKMYLSKEINGKSVVIDSDGADGFGDFFAYTYPNTDSENLAQVVITYQVGQDSYTSRSFVINREGTDKNGGTLYVNSNYIYNLNVNLNITNYRVDCDIFCTTNKWIYNEGSHDLTGDLVKKQ